MIEYKYFESIRELVVDANKKGLQPEDIIQIIPGQGISGYYMVYRKPEQKKDE